METGNARHSPPPFMSPVDSPVHRPTTPPHPDGSPTNRPLLDTLTKSEERLKYRSWREGNAEFPHSNLATQRFRDGSHVDKKIEATLPKAEQPVAARSRKASHYLRVFKENDAAEEQKRWEGRAKERRPTDRALSSHQEEGIDKSRASHNRSATSQPSSAVHSPQTGPEGSYFEIVQTPVSEVEDELKADGGEESLYSVEANHRHDLPLRLLEEIRNFGNLTPGANRGSSFSKSLPTSAAERLLKARPTSEVHEPSDYFQIAPNDTQERSSASDEDDSEKEQIASALYFPHRQLQSPNQLPREEAVRKAEGEGPREQKTISTGKGPKGWSTGEAIKTPQEVEISLQSQDTNQCLYGDISTTAPVSPVDEKPLTSPPDATTSTESEYESLAESSHSLQGYESSATDDLGTTPTATPRKKETKPLPAPQPQAQPQPPAPLGAVELKPYDHQVGGHSTVYRFSRRAVCKQLNNRENEFYETVERHHPEMLEFLPRYDSFLSLSVLV